MRGWGAVVVALALLVTGCDEGPQEEAPRADHTTAARRAAEPGQVDPASGAFAQAWQADVRGRFAMPRTWLAYAAGQLLVISPRGVDAYDAGSGALRWHYYEPGRNVTGHALTGGSLVLVTLASKGDDRAVGLDAATGAELWRSTAYGATDSLGRAASGRGVIVLHDRANPSVLLGVDARTGARRWSWPGPKRLASGESPCEYGMQDSDGALVLLRTVCGPEEKLYALDPATGRPLWQRVSQFQPLPRAAPMSRSGVTLVPEQHSRFSGFILVGRDGAELHRWASAYPIGGSLAIIGGRAIVNYPYDAPTPDTGIRNRLVSVDLRTGGAGEPVESRVTGGLSVGSGVLYTWRDRLGEFGGSSGTFEAPLVPAGLEVVDPETLRGTPVPLPSSAASGFWAGDVPSPQALLDGGRGYTAVPVNGGLRLTAYAPGDRASPAATGGVPAGDWPDACDLLNGVKELDHKTARPDLEIGDVTIPNWHCSIGIGRSTGYREVGVRIAWVARDEAEADRMLDPYGARVELPALGREAYRLGDATTIVLRVGRYIAVVEDDTERDAAPMAEIVARNLAGLGS